MIRYSDELIEEIRSSNDIVDTISQYVQLKRKGRNFFGLCPFHKEKSPSFSVSPDKQIFHCFGCGVCSGFPLGRCGGGHCDRDQPGSQRGSDHSLPGRFQRHAVASAGGQAAP